MKLFLIACGVLLLGEKTFSAARGGGVRCYDCNYDPDGRTKSADGKSSYAGNRRGFPKCALNAHEDHFVDRWRCHSETCFIRRDPNGLVYRGCADLWNLPWRVNTNANCTYQGQKPSLWWFCKGDLCNKGRFGTGDICQDVDSAWGSDGYYGEIPKEQREAYSGGNRGVKKRQNGGLGENGKLPKSGVKEALFKRVYGKNGNGGESSKTNVDDRAHSKGGYDNMANRGSKSGYVNGDEPSTKRSYGAEEAYSSQTTPPTNERWSRGMSSKRDPGDTGDGKSSRNGYNSGATSKSVSPDRGESNSNGGYRDAVSYPTELDPNYKSSHTQRYVSDNPSLHYKTWDSPQNGEAWEAAPEQYWDPPSSPDKSWEPQPSQDKSLNPPPAQDKSWDPPSAQDMSWDPQPSQDKSWDPQPAQDKSWDPQPSQDKSWDPQPVPEKSWDPPSAQDKSWDPQPSQDKSWDPPPAQDKSWNPQPVKDKSWNPTSGKDKSWEPQPVQAKSWNPQPSQDKSWDPQPSQDKSWDPTSGQDKSWEPRPAQDKSFNPPSAPDKSWDPQPAQDKSWEPQPSQDKSWDPTSGQDKSWEPRPAQDKSWEPQPSQDKSWDPQLAQDKSWNPPSAPDKSWDPQPAQDKSWDPQPSQDKSWDPQPAQDKSWNPPSAQDESWNSPSAQDESWDPPSAQDESWNPPSAQAMSWNPQPAEDKSWNPASKEPAYHEKAWGLSWVPPKDPVNSYKSWTPGEDNGPASEGNYDSPSFPGKTAGEKKTAGEEDNQVGLWQTQPQEPGTRNYAWDPYDEGTAYAYTYSESEETVSSKSVPDSRSQSSSPNDDKYWEGDTYDKTGKDGTFLPWDNREPTDVNIYAYYGDYGEPEAGVQNEPASFKEAPNNPYDEAIPVLSESPCDGSCLGNPSGLFGHPERPDWFIQCGNGLHYGKVCHCCTPFYLRCPQRTAFDVVTRVCSDATDNTGRYKSIY